MDSVYTSTITTAAQARGITVSVLDPVLPIFELMYNDVKHRCYNGLTDTVGAATFHLAQDKGAANRFLRKNGFPVPLQEVYSDFDKAAAFLNACTCIVVKPVAQWGGRGVSTHVTNANDLKAAIDFARQCSDEIVLEECVSGTDWRLIYVNYRYVCAIQRNPACVEGNGGDTVRKLINDRNARIHATDPSNLIPMDKETIRAVESIGLHLDSIPAKGQSVQVRRTTNYHTGGTVAVITDKVDTSIIECGQNVAKLFGIPVMGVDILVNQQSGKFNIIELSPDLAISPPEGAIVAEAWLNFLFPESVSLKRDPAEKFEL